MSSSKQPAKSGGWGSLFTNAVANLESRLDTILAEDADASARERAAEKVKKETASRARSNSGRSNVSSEKPTTPGNREAPVYTARGNDRLAERLARATAQKSTSQNTSAQPSRVGTPLGDADSVRMSTDSSRAVEDPVESSPSTSGPQLQVSSTPTENVEDSRSASSSAGPSLLASALPMNPARHSTEGPSPSVDTNSKGLSPRLSTDTSAGVGESTMQSEVESVADTLKLLESYKADEKQRQEEMHAYMERIDALQAKLQYLAKETVAAAKEVNAAAKTGSETARLAEKDEKIALLMQEGEQLSKTEMRHLQVIKKLRSKATEDEQAAQDLRKKLDASNRLESDLKHKVKRAETAQRQAEDKADQIENIVKQVNELESERASAAKRIRALTAQLKEAKDQIESAERAQKESSNNLSEQDRARLRDLENELEDARIEKKLAADRASTESRKLREEISAQKQSSEIRESELKTEINALESRLEVVRSRAEEASSDGVVDGGSVKLMRQVETLQEQYALAKDNWETIENSLNARVSALEAERDEASKRESELRKKTRDLSSRCRKAEDELEASLELSRTQGQQVKDLQEVVRVAQEKHETAMTALSDAKAEFERRRKLWESETQQRIEEERLRFLSTQSYQPGFRALDPPTPSRKNSSPADALNGDFFGRRSRTLGQEVSSRRNSAMPIPLRSPQPYTPSREQSPCLSRHESVVTLDLPTTGVPATPSIEVDQDFGSSSPQRTINDLVSTSTAGAGPSVQLVERLSLAVRRLESEKASFKDELARLAAQRDDARNEIVTLMREVETKRGKEQQATANEDMRKRYEASLEILGEREEEVQELRQDLDEMKRMYKELVEDKVGPGAK